MTARLGVLMLALALCTGCLSIAGVVAADTAEQRLAWTEQRLANVIRERCVEQHPEWGADDCARIAKGVAWKGMTRAQLVAAWGAPASAEPTARGEHLVWGASLWADVESGVVVAGFRSRPL